jgi:uncharacterized membrane protein YphA (DoxX/SURF4 family)
MNALRVNEAATSELRMNAASVKTMSAQLGRHVFGLAGILFGLIGLYWREFNNWNQIRPLGDVRHPGVLACIVAVIEIFGGVAIQWRKTARIGAAVLGVTYLIFALLWVPIIAAKPQIYDSWGNFFEQFSLVSGALIVYATAGRDASDGTSNAARWGYIFFGICVVSFTLEQVFYLSGTASFVPKWIPPGQMFWAVITTIAFALAAIALLSGRLSLLAARLTTAMIVGFGLFVWLPAPFADPHQLINWAGNAENLAIAGSAWIVADLLASKRSRPMVSSSGITTAKV